MATIRVNKTKNYTVMANYHLQDKNLTLKAKGLQSLMLSLPEQWDYSTEGLATLSKDGKDSVMTALQELEKYGYLVRTRKLNDKNQFDGYIYDIYEYPQRGNPYLENPNTEKPTTEIPTQLNTNKVNTKELIKHKYGEYAHVLLTNEQFDKLAKEYGNQETREAIKYLDEYIEMKGAKYKNHYLVLRKWVFEALKEKRQKNYNSGMITHEYTKEELESLYDSLDEE